jgi:anaphase-promoting complex subunit 8
MTDFRRACELLSALPQEYRTAPHLPFSPPPQPQSHLAHSPPSPALHSRPSLGEFLPSPGPGAFGDPAIAGPSKQTYGYAEIETEDDVLEEDEYQLAKSYFDIKEFDRVVYTLRAARGKRSVFLRVYSAYLVCRSQSYSPMIPPVGR